MGDIRKLDPQLLLVFESLMDTQSATLSAARLNLSQSAVSGSLKRLREVFDDPLFERRSHGLVPTDRATDLIAPVGEVLAGLRGLAAPNVFEPAQIRGMVTFLATDFAIATLLAPFRARLAEHAPHLRVAFRPFTGIDIASTRHLNDVDFVIGSRGMLPESYVLTSLRTDPLKVFLSKDHPLAHGDLTLSDLTEFPHVVVSLRGTNAATVLDDRLAQHGLTRKVETLCFSFLTLPVLLSDGNSLAIAPHALIDTTRGDLIVKDLPIPLPDIDLFAAWHPRYRNDPRHRWLRHLLESVARRDAPT